MEMEGIPASDVRTSCEAAVCAKYLSVDPSAIGSGKKEDNVGDIIRLSEPLERCHAADLLDLLFGLAVQKEFRPDRPRCNRVDRNLLSAKLVGDNMDEVFDARLG